MAKVTRTPAEIAAGYTIDDARLADLPPTPAEIREAEEVLKRAAEQYLRDLEDKFVKAVKHLGDLFRHHEAAQVISEPLPAEKKKEISDFLDEHAPPKEAELPAPDMTVPGLAGITHDTSVPVNMGGFPDPHPEPLKPEEQMPISVQVPKP